MLTAFNRTLQGDFWWYQKKAVPLHCHSEERLLMATRRKEFPTDSTPMTKRTIIINQ